MRNHYQSIRQMIAENRVAEFSYTFDSPIYSTEYADIKRHVGSKLSDDKNLNLSWPACLFTGINTGPYGAIDLIRYREKLAKVLVRQHDKHVAKLPDAQRAVENMRRNGQNVADVTVDSLLEEVRRVFNATSKWIALCVSIVEAKNLVKKGRAPSTKPRVTPARTIHNTGTCAICRQNVKMEKGKIVHHGFTLQWGGRNGACFGCRYAPIEVSSDALVAFVRHLDSAHRNVCNDLERAKVGPEKVETVDAGGKPQTITKATLILRLESNLREIAWLTKETKAAITAWKPMPLPEERLTASA